MLKTIYHDDFNRITIYLSISIDRSDLESPYGYQAVYYALLR